MAQSLAPYAVMSLGVTFVIATGGIDLSIGTVCIASAVVAGKMYTSGLLGQNLWLTIPIMIAIGTLFGFINGMLIAKLKMPAFIATLGTMMISRGLSALIVSDPNIFFPSGTWFNKTFSNANGIPTGIFWIIGFTLICMYIMYKNKIGRYILSIGSNEEATRLSGINTDKYKIIAYTFAGSAPESRQFSGHRHFRQSQRQQETEWNLMQLQEFTSEEQAQPAESLLLQAR